MASFRMLLKVLPVACGIAAIVGLTLLPTDARAATVVVTAATPNGWAFDNRDGDGNVITPTTGSYVNGPATPPLGTGSANLTLPVGSGENGSELRSTNYAGLALSAINALTYSTYTTANNLQQFPYLVLEVSWTTGSNAYDDRLFFEPPYQTTSTGNPSLPNQADTAYNTWQTWNALSGGWWANSGFGGNGGTNVDSLANYIALHPDAHIINNPSGLGGIEFRVGFAEANYAYNGYVDAFTINDTTYDFEAAAATPIPATLPLFSSGLGLIGFLSWRKKRRRAAAA